MRKSGRIAAVAAALTVSALAAAGPATAAGPTGEFAKFEHCPYTDPVVEGCIYSVTSSGSFKLGTTTVPITADNPIILQGGVGGADSAGNNLFFAAVGADTLSKTRLAVPGGLIGLLPGTMVPPGTDNDVFATAEQVGGIKFNAGAFLGSNDPALQLPVRVHLENPFLGQSCYVGPFTLKLITGTTSPPAAGAPLTGTIGETSITGDFGIFNFLGAKLVDNAFAVPAATRCGRSAAERPAVTAAVNLKTGLPAKAGVSAAILQGDTFLGIRTAVEASAQP